MKNGHALWEPTTLGQVAELVGGGTPPRAIESNFGDYIDWVTPSDLPSIGIVSELGEVSERLSKQGLDGSSARRLPENTVLFSSRASIGKIAVANRACTTNQGFANFVPRPGTIDPWFLAYLLRRFTADILQLAGETTYKEVSRGKLRDFRVSIPSLKEQLRIVGRIKEMLARVDEAITLRSEIAKETMAVFPSVLASRFDDLAATAPVVSVESVISESRYGTSQKCDRDESATPVLRIPNVADGKVNLDNLKYRPFEASEMRQLKLLTGDVLVVRTNGSKELVGRCAVFEKQDRDFAFASYLIRLRPDKKKVVPQYMAYFLESTRGRDAIASIRKTSAGQYNVNSENLRAIEMPCPPLSVQEQAVEQMDEQRAVTRQIREQVAQRRLEEQPLRDAILRKAFAGEL